MSEFNSFSDYLETGSVLNESSITESLKDVTIYPHNGKGNSNRVHDDSSPKLSGDIKKYHIGTIGHLYKGKSIWNQLFELDEYDKKEFGSKGVFGFSNRAMIHQERTIGKIVGNKIYFIDNDKYLLGEVSFGGRGVRIEFITIHNDKYTVDSLKALIG